MDVDIAENNTNNNQSVQIPSTQTTAPTIINFPREINSLKKNVYYLKKNLS